MQQQQRPKTTAFLVASFSTFEIPTLAELRPPAFSSHDAPLSWPFSSRALPPPSQLWLHGAGTGCSSGQQASTLPGLSASDPEPRLILCPPAAGGCRASYLVSGAADSRNSPWTSVLGVALTFAGSRPLCSLTGARAGMADVRHAPRPSPSVACLQDRIRYPCRAVLGPFGRPVSLSPSSWTWLAAAS